MLDRKKILYHTQFIWLGILLCFGSPLKMFREYSNDSSVFFTAFFLGNPSSRPQIHQHRCEIGNFSGKVPPIQIPFATSDEPFFHSFMIQFFSSTYNFCAGGLFRTLAADLLSTAAALQRKPSGCPVQSALLRGGSTTCLRRNVPRGTQGMAVHLVIHQNGFLWNLNIDSS